jgi:hypothetical protein
MMQKIKTAVLEIVAIVLGCGVWFLSALYWEWYLMGGIIGFMVGIGAVFVFNLIGGVTKWWKPVDIEDFRVYGWIPW